REVFLDHLDDEVALAGLVEIVLEVADGDEVGVARREEGGGLGLERLLLTAEGEGVATAFAVGGNDVEQQHFDAGAGEMRGDTGAHDAGSENGDLLELSHVGVSSLRL